MKCITLYGTCFNIKMKGTKGEVEGKNEEKRIYLQRTPEHDQGDEIN